jgi:hypothetical protein
MRRFTLFSLLDSFRFPHFIEIVVGVNEAFVAEDCITRRLGSLFLYTLRGNDWLSY